MASPNGFSGGSLRPGAWEPQKALPLRSRVQKENCSGVCLPGPPARVRPPSLPSTGPEGAGAGGHPARAGRFLSPGGSRHCLPHRRHSSPASPLCQALSRRSSHQARPRKEGLTQEPLSPLWSRRFRQGAACACLAAGLGPGSACPPLRGHSQPWPTLVVPPPPSCTPRGCPRARLSSARCTHTCPHSSPDRRLCQCPVKCDRGQMQKPTWTKQDG